ncbi:MAG: SURF1 family protein [Pikeienuella sp.]
MSDENTSKGGADTRRPSSLGPRRYGMIVVGVIGVVTLVALCVWQVQRLAWKQDIIATLSGRLAAAPIPLPTTFDRETLEFARVRVTGQFTDQVGKHGFADAPLLTSLRPYGPGYRVIQPFNLADGRRVMVDRGFVPVASKNRHGAAAVPTPAPADFITLVGALRWPDEINATPFGENDNVWTSRDLSVMADLFGTEEVLIVAETNTAVMDWPKPQPLVAVQIRNNHMEYALTWGALAVVWAIMTGWLAFRPQTAKDV